MKTSTQFARGDEHETFTSSRVDAMNDLFRDVPAEERGDLIAQAWFHEGPSALELELVGDGAEDSAGQKFVEGVRDTVDERADELIDLLLMEAPRRATRRSVGFALNSRALTDFYRRNARACLVAGGFLIGAMSAGGVAYALQSKEDSAPVAEEHGQRLSQNMVTAVAAELTR